MQKILGRSTVRWVALGTVGTVLALLGLGYLWLRTTSGVRDPGSDCRGVVVTGVDATTADAVRSGVCRTVDGLVEAWDAGDAEAYASHFTPEATYAAFTGTVYRGRADIAAGHAALFDGLLADTRLGVRYLGIDVVRPDVVRVLTRGDTYEGATTPDDLSKVQTHLMVVEDGRWQVAAFQNTSRSPVMERVQFLLNPGSRPLAEQ